MSKWCFKTKLLSWGLWQRKQWLWNSGHINFRIFRMAVKMALNPRMGYARKSGYCTSSYFCAYFKFTFLKKRHMSQKGRNMSGMWLSRNVSRCKMGQVCKDKNESPVNRIITYSGTYYLHINIYLIKMIYFNYNKAPKFVIDLICGLLCLWNKTGVSRVETT